MASRTGSGGGHGRLTADGAWDAAVLGGGPAGSVAAAFAAGRGLKVVVIEREVFPRHKVCGDCLNPRSQPVLERLGVAAGVHGMSIPVLAVEFVANSGPPAIVDLPAGAERVVRRSQLDGLLLNAAASAGARILNGSPLTGIREVPGGGWVLSTAAGDEVRSRCVVVADGRNSTACRLLHLGPPPQSRRVAVQAHVWLPDYPADRIRLRLMPHGYCGMAPLGGGWVNVCVVSTPESLTTAREECRRENGVAEDVRWHSVAPLERPDIDASPLAGMFLAGDAARVLEPFTGEGIALALETGELAAEAAARHLDGLESAAWYRRRHSAAYRRTRWVNRLTRAAVTSPRFGSTLVATGARFPAILRWLTARVITGHPPG